MLRIDGTRYDTKEFNRAEFYRVLGWTMPAAK